VLARNAHLIAVSDDFFAFQQKAEQFFWLLEGVSGHRNLSVKVTHPVQKLAWQLRYVKTKRNQKSPTPCTMVIKEKQY
jgi:hypothetical protein